MRRLSAPIEPEIVEDSRTALTAEVSAGAAPTITVADNTGFVDDDIVMVGRRGQEGAELTTATATPAAGTSLALAALTKAHKIGTPVVRMRYDKRRFYGCTTESGSYTELTAYGSPAPIVVDDPQGTVIEYDGNEGYEWFKATYLNTVTNEETDIDDATAVSGTSTGRYATLLAIRRKAKIEDNPYIDDDRLEGARQYAESTINSSVLSQYSLPLASVPGIITETCRLLAAGSILWEEYGKDGEGKSMLDKAEATLKDIREGKLKLIDSDGAEMAQPERESPSFYPNDTSRDSLTDPTRQKMTRNKVY